MLIVLWSCVGIIFVMLYIFGIYAYIDSKTMTNVKGYDSTNIFGAPTRQYTHDNREATTNEYRKSLIWPVFFVFAIFKIICIGLPVIVIETTAPSILGALGKNYKDTTLKTKIDKIGNWII